MNAEVVRAFLYPLQERLLGRPTFRLLGEIEESQWHSPQRLARLQAEKLRRLLGHFSRVSADHGRWFATHGIDPLREDPFEALRCLPVQDKRAIRARMTSQRGADRRRGIRRMSTGGSTGEPLTFLVDQMRSAFDKAARMRTHRWFGVQPGDKEAYLWGAPIANRRQDRVRTIRDYFLNDLLLSAFDLSRDGAARYFQKLERFNPVCVFGYPSSLVKLCEFATESGRRLRLGALRAVFVTGEVLDERQRATLEAFFNVPLANGYGGRDSGFCAHQCEQGHMHVTSEHIVMEIVDAELQPVPNGCQGEIVITNLDNYATPFVRYRTGDIGRLLDVPCQCGRGLQVMDVVAGRKTDHLVAADGSLRHALSVIYLMREIEEIDQFQIRQKSDRSIDLRVVSPKGVADATRQRILREVRDCLGTALPTTLEIVDRIDVQASGKFRHVISEAAQ